jgi:hypothetical protein
VFSGAGGTRNALNRGAERPLTAFVSHDSPVESTCRPPSGPPELPNPGISPLRAPKAIVVSGAVDRDPRSLSPGPPPSWFRVQADSWFRMQGHSWFQMQT